MHELQHPDTDEQALRALQMRAVLDVVRSVLSDLDIESVLGHLVESARTLGRATYAALGVLDSSRGRLDRFITSGIDERTRQAIGHPPLGRGVLGELIADPRPLRLDDVGSHPRSYGFPPGHPPMSCFLGVPVVVAGQPFGNLYLTNKTDGGSFTAADEESLLLLAEFAGIAIDHARRYSRTESERSDLKNSVEALDATVQIAQAVGGETNLDAVLELVAKRGRALVSARALVIEREQHGQTFVAAAAGEVPAGLVGREVDAKDSVASSALRSLRTMRLEESGNRIRFQRHGLGQFGITAECGLVVPLVFRGQGYGVLIAIDRIDGGTAFDAGDQRLLEAFAVSAATAIATAVSVERERDSQRLAAAELERTRWARELHDETLQNLAALRLALASHLRVGDPAGMAKAIREAMEQIDLEIVSLRSLIADVRPTALDDLGLEPAIEALAERTRRQGLNVSLEVELAFAQGRQPERLNMETETALYRIIQEALTNARKHGHAKHVRIRVQEGEGEVEATIQDDGAGFDPAEKNASGFGLIGVQERVDLLAGQLSIVSSPGQGTTVSAVLPITRRGTADSATISSTSA